MQLFTLLIPWTHFRRILLIQLAEIGELHLVARGHIEIGAVQPLLHLAESVEHIARHIQSQHRCQHDIHEVDHALTRRHSGHIITTCHILMELNRCIKKL